jgi:hypothetical protein
MDTVVKIDKAERVVPPKPVRNKLRSRIHKKQGVWVMRGGAPLSEDVVEKTMQQIQRKREQSFLGTQKRNTSDTSVLVPVFVEDTSS